MQTQWRTGTGGLVGLDWPAVRQVAAWHGVDVRLPRIFTGLQLCEAHLLHLQQQPKPKANP